MNQSGIEWICESDGTKGLTTNPVIGCSRISPGCGGGYIKGPNGEQGGCWAEDLVSTRMSKNPKLPMYHDLARPGGGWSGKVKLVPERLKEIVALGRARKRNKGGKLVPFGSRVFACDLSDLFHDDVPFEYIAAVFGAMACAPQHLFYVLTKRPTRAVEWAKWAQEAKDGPTQFCADVCTAYDPSTHAGDLVAAYAMVRSVYSQADALGRCPTQDEAIAGAKPHWPLPNVAFGVTCEDRRYGVPRLDLARQFPARWHWLSVEPQLEDLGDVDFTGFDLVISGGEAGPGSRQFDLQWARNVRDAARKAGARWFCKQLGDNVFDNGVPLEFGKKGNDFDSFPSDLRIRENLPLPNSSVWT
jgi:protein gp37